MSELQAAYLRACELDVLVPKPGNVSVAAAGHRMQAQQFIESAQASAPALFERGAPVGQRIEAAVAATWARVGCNTNLGIVLLCASLAAAAERPQACSHPQALRQALGQVLAGLGVDDTRACYRAIAMANPAGLGTQAEEDVHDTPQLKLREAMALAAARDSIARQYAQGFADIFDTGLPLAEPLSSQAGVLDDATRQSVQRVFLGFLSAWPDSHIARKHGAALAQTVMAAAQAHSVPQDAASQRAWLQWDRELKAQGLNPGTTADLSVASLFAALLLQSR